jgi:predicted transcriptional regulator
MMSVTSIRIQPDLQEELEALAIRLRRSKNWLLNQALRAFIAEQNIEDLRWKETIAAMESVAQGRVVPADEVRDWLNSWGGPDELPPPQVSR